MKRHRSETCSVEWYILSKISSGKGQQTRITQHKRKAKRTALSQQMATRLITKQNEQLKQKSGKNNVSDDKPQQKRCLGKINNKYLTTMLAWSEYINCFIKLRAHNVNVVLFYIYLSLIYLFIWLIVYYMYRVRSFHTYFSTSLVFLASFWVTFRNKSMEFYQSRNGHFMTLWTIGTATVLMLIHLLMWRWFRSWYSYTNQQNWNKKTLMQSIKYAAKLFFILVLFYWRSF